MSELTPIFTLDQLSRIQGPALKKVLEDRNKFVKIYKIIEDYIRKHNLIVGGSISVKQLVSENRTQNDFEYIVYSEHPAKHAYDISNLIAPITQAIRLQTNIYGEELTIWVHGRSMVQIIGLAEKMRDIIRPTKLGGPLLYIPADYHLLYIYRDLYLPITDNWEESLKYEYQLYKILYREFEDNPKKFIGGKKSKVKDDNIQKIKRELKCQLLQFLPELNVVLVGHYAYSTLMNTENPKDTDKNIENLNNKNNENPKDTDTKNISIIGSDVVSEIRTWITHKTGLATSEKQMKVMMLTDFRLTRTTIYLKYKEEQFPVLYVYNQSDYDLIPYNISKSAPFEGMIGNPFVILRFMLVDIWIIKIIRAFGGINADFAYNRISDMYQYVFKLREKLVLDKTKAYSKDENDLWSIFQPTKRYMGSYYSDRNAKKDLIKNQKRTFDYYPVLHKSQHGSYKIL